MAIGGYKDKIQALTQFNSGWQTFKSSLAWWGVALGGVVMTVFVPFPAAKYAGVFLVGYGGGMLYFYYSGQIVQVDQGQLVGILDRETIGKLKAAGQACGPYPKDNSKQICLPTQADFQDPRKYDATNKAADVRSYDSRCTEVRLYTGDSVPNDIAERNEQWNLYSCAAVASRRTKIIGVDVPPKTKRGVDVA